jgi:CHASE3 domain sensor protein
MNNQNPKLKNILGLALRVAVSFVIIAVIFWKYEELKNIDVSNLTPMDALNTIYRLQNKLNNRW